MKILLTILLVISLFSWGQEVELNPYRITKNDRWVMSCFLGYGLAKGFADEIEYHHLAFSKRFPGLFKNGNKFWDGRYDDDGIWDAKHMLAGLQASFMTAAVCIKIGDLKNYPKKHRFKKIMVDIIKYDFSRRLGFFLSYNVINQNPIFK